MWVKQGRKLGEVGRAFWLRCKFGPEWRREGEEVGWKYTRLACLLRRVQQTWRWIFEAKSIVRGVPCLLGMGLPSSLRKDYSLPGSTSRGCGFSISVVMTFRGAVQADSIFPRLTLDLLLCICSWMTSSTPSTWSVT